MEELRDHLPVSEGYALAHSVARDLGMARGIGDIVLKTRGVHRSEPVFLLQLKP